MIGDTLRLPLAYQDHCKESILVCSTLYPDICESPQFYQIFPISGVVLFHLARLRADKEFCSMLEPAQVHNNVKVISS